MPRKRNSVAEWRPHEFVHASVEAMFEEGWLKTELKPQVDALLKAVTREPRSLLMLDYDGTIAPFRKHRDQAIPYPGFAALIEKIVGCGKTRVVIISGRDANEIVPLLDIDPPPELWGLHGLQRLKPDGTSELSPLDRSTIESLAVAESWLHSQHLDHTGEVKRGSIAV